jgi:CheY-like chemotaxis protein
VVLLDVTMPDMDGVETLKRLAAAARVAHHQR